MVSRKKELGFTVLEIALVVFVVGVVIAFVAPQIVRSLREHKLNIAVRDTTDLIQRAKTQAMADNHNSSFVVDTAGRRIGLIVYDDAGAVVRTDYIPLPDGVNFEMPEGVIAPMAGAPASRAVSFPPQGDSTTVFQQDFNSRGFPEVAASGAINALYLGNGHTYRAITITSVGGIRTWWWEEGAWTAAHN